MSQPASAPAHPLPRADGELLLLHNPRCSKSRAALALLEERGVPCSVRRYLEEPLSREELDDLRRRLERPAGQWARVREEPVREAGLDAGADDDAWLELMAREPAVMERPILVGARRAVVGRPTEALLELLGEGAP